MLRKGKGGYIYEMLKSREQYDDSMDVAGKEKRKAEKLDPAHQILYQVPWINLRLAANGGDHVNQQALTNRWKVISK